MQIEISDDLAQQVQGLSPIKLKGQDFCFFADWLIAVGLGTVHAALAAHPEYSLGDLVMMRYRDECH